MILDIIVILLVGYVVVNSYKLQERYFKELESYRKALLAKSLPEYSASKFIENPKLTEEEVPADSDEIGEVDDKSFMKAISQDYEYDEEPYSSE